MGFKLSVVRITRDLAGLSLPASLRARYFLDRLHFSLRQFCDERRDDPAFCAAALPGFRRAGRW